jgi:hypothetical protein
VIASWSRRAFVAGRRNGRFFRTWVIAALVAFTLIPPVSALINGKPVAGTGDLVRLVFKSGRVCSGAYLDPTTILTAAHCLRTEAGESMHALETVLSADDVPLAVTQVRNVPHPDFDGGFFPTHDVGIIKTSKNPRFAGQFALDTEKPPIAGGARYFGCGVVGFAPRTRARREGTNGFLRIGSVLFSVGKSKAVADDPGTGVSIAPNDSGGPVLSPWTGKVIAVATQATAATSARFGLPAISVATSVVGGANGDFVRANLGK